MRRASGAGFPSALSYHSIQDIDGFWGRLVKDNFLGENVIATFNCKTDMISFGRKKKKEVTMCFCEHKDLEGNKSHARSMYHQCLNLK